MEIGIKARAYGGIDIDKEAELLAENGFTKSFAMASDKDLDKIVKAFSAKGIEIDCLHAPFRPVGNCVSNDVWKKGLRGDKWIRLMMEAVDICAKYGIKKAVFHLSSGDNAPPVSDIGRKRYKKLIDYAVKQGVTPCFENIRKLVNLAFVLEQFENAKFCFDCGHEKCFTKGIDFMPLFGDRLEYVHIHDNMKEHNRDLHMIPFDGKLDYSRIAKQIAESPYGGPLMLEVMANNSDYYKDASAEEYYKRAGESARRISSLVETFR